MRAPFRAAVGWGVRAFCTEADATRALPDKLIKEIEFIYIVFEHFTTIEECTL